MKLFLKLLFAAIFLVMLWINVKAANSIGLLADIPRFASDPWAVATLYDAYCGFITFYCWVVFRERGWVARIVWFVLIMALGNIAMSLYVLTQLFRLKESEPVSTLFQPKAAA